VRDAGSRVIYGGMGGIPSQTGFDSICPHNSDLLHQLVVLSRTYDTLYALDRNNALQRSHAESK